LFEDAPQLLLKKASGDGDQEKRTRPALTCKRLRESKNRGRIQIKRRPRWRRHGAVHKERVAAQFDIVIDNRLARDLTAAGFFRARKSPLFLKSVKPF
jgi:hypothetical protein